MTTKTILGARVRQQVGVPHGAHHRRILEGEKKRGMREWSTRGRGPREGRRREIKAGPRRTGRAEGRVPGGPEDPREGVSYRGR